MCWPPPQSLPSLARYPGVADLDNIASVAGDTAARHIEDTLLVIDAPHPETAAPAEMAANIPRHLLTGEHAGLVIAGANTAWSPVGLGHSMGGWHASKAPSLHHTLEASVDCSAVHVHPLTN